MTCMAALITGSSAEHNSDGCHGEMYFDIVLIYSTERGNHRTPLPPNRICKNLNEPSTQLSEFQIPFAPSTDRSHGTKPSVLNSLLTRATLWLSNTKSHGLLKTKRLLYQLRIPDQKLFQTTSYATINDSDLSCS